MQRLSDNLQSLCLEFLHPRDFAKIWRLSKHWALMATKISCLHCTLNIRNTQMMKYKPRSISIRGDIDCRHMQWVRVINFQRQGKTIEFEQLVNLEEIYGVEKPLPLLRTKLRRIECIQMSRDDLITQLASLPQTVEYIRTLHDIGDHPLLADRDLILDIEMKTPIIGPHHPGIVYSLYITAKDIDWLADFRPTKSIFALTAEINLTEENQDYFIQHAPKLIDTDNTLSFLVEYWPKNFPETMLPDIEALCIYSNGPNMATIAAMRNLKDLTFSGVDADFGIQIKCEKSRFKYWPLMDIIYDFSGTGVWEDVIKFLHDNDKPKYPYKISAPTKREVITAHLRDRGMESVFRVEN